MSAPSRRRYRCAECGKRYTEKQAEKAMRDGCEAGCSGIDIEELYEAEDAPSSCEVKES